jgi:plasmid stabilization system protein ParE
MRRVVFGKQAHRDLDQIWSFVARDSIRAAEKVADAMERAVRQLAHMPGLGHERLELHARRYRVWSVYSYLIIYRYGPKTLTVVRIVHGARNLRRLFPDK